MNHLQLLNLLTAIDASGALEMRLPNGDRGVDQVAFEMDLDPSEVYELLERASIEWNRVKLCASCQQDKEPWTETERAAYNGLSSADYHNPL